MIDSTPELRIHQVDGGIDLRICGTDDDLLAMFGMLAHFLVKHQHASPALLRATIDAAEDGSTEKLILQHVTPVVVDCSRIPFGKEGTHHEG